MVKNDETNNESKGNNNLQTTLPLASFLLVTIYIVIYDKTLGCISTFIINTYNNRVWMVAEIVICQTQDHL